MKSPVSVVVVREGKERKSNSSQYQNTSINRTLLGYQLGDTPVLETPIWQISSDDKWRFSLRKFLDGDLQRIRLAV